MTGVFGLFLSKELKYFLHTGIAGDFGCPLVKIAHILFCLDGQLERFLMLELLRHAYSSLVDG
jgi:hypothetical protein